MELASLSALHDQFECTKRCRSQKHIAAILSALTKGSPEEVKSFCLTQCRNFWRISDSVGRNLVHWCASTEQVDLLEWLLGHFKLDLSIKDGESGYTALHRAVLYGQLACAQLLSEHVGCPVSAVDREGFTAIGIASRDRLPGGYVDSCSPIEVYSCGENMTYNLGHRNAKPRSVPEPVDFFRRNDIVLTAVSMAKFHSLWLTSDGRVFACGHGLGGRLGSGAEDPAVVPQQVQLPEPCVSVAAAADHSVFVTQSGIAYTCGMNNHRQLGQAAATENKAKPTSGSSNVVADKSLLARPVVMPKVVKGGRGFVGCCAGSCHSVAWSKQELFTWGLNAGHLGHAKEEASAYVLFPKLVSQVITSHDFAIENVVCSDGAVGLLSSKGDILVLTRYEIKRIALRQLDVKSLHMIGGHLLNLDSAGVPIAKEFTADLRVCLLSKSGKLFLWQESDPEFRRCVFSGATQKIYPVDIAQAQTGVLLVSPIGNLYSGRFDKPAEIVSTKKKDATPAVGSLGGSSSSGFGFGGKANFLDRRECQKIALTYVPAVHRGVRVGASADGRNFWVFQQHPATELVELPSVSASNYVKDFAMFFEQSAEGDVLHDVVITCVPGEKWPAQFSRRFPCHRFVLMSRCTYFEKHLAVLESCVESGDSVVEFAVEGTHSEIFRQLLLFIYSDSCSLLDVGKSFYLPGTQQQAVQLHAMENSSTAVIHKPEGKTAKKKKAEALNNAAWDFLNPLKLATDAAKKFGIKSLVAKLDSLLWDPASGKIQLKSHFSAPVPRLSFSRQDLPELHDVAVKALDARELNCHRCILAARLEYFSCMFASGWRESGRERRVVPIPVGFQVMSDLLYFLYTDKLPADATKSDDPERLCQLLLHSDQFLAHRLREFCEVALANMISLRNATELLEFSSMYHADQLKTTCLQFISLNFCALFESGALKVLSRERLLELGGYYRNFFPSVRNRKIRSYKSEFPSKGDLQKCVLDFPPSYFDKLPDEELVSLYVLEPGSSAASGVAGGALPVSGAGAPSSSPAATPFSSGGRRRHGSARSLGSVSESENVDPLSSASGAVPSLHVKDVEKLRRSTPDRQDRGKSPTSSAEAAWKQDIIAKMRAVALNLHQISEDCQSEQALPGPLTADNNSAKKKLGSIVSAASFEEAREENYFAARRRQKLAEESVEPVALSSPRPKPWTAMARNQNNVGGDISLRDVMQQEVKLKQAEQELRELEKQRQQLATPKKSLIRDAASPWKIIEPHAAAAISGAITTPPTMSQFSPNNVPAAVSSDGAASSSSPQQPDRDRAGSFRAILEEEHERQSGRQRQEKKSFAVIQIEEQAMQELLLFYRSEENFDEHITVERVSKHGVAEPVWKALL